MLSQVWDRPGLAGQPEFAPAHLLFCPLCLQIWPEGLCIYKGSCKILEFDAFWTQLPLRTQAERGRAWYNAGWMWGGEG